MKKINLLLSLLIAVVFSGYSQFRIETVPPLNGGNGSAGTAFQLTVKSPIILDSLLQSFNTGSSSADVWYTATDTVGPPNITTANGWSQLVTALPVTPAVGGAGTLDPLPTNLNLVLTPGIYRFYISAVGNVIYTTWNAANQDVYSDNFITIKNGTNYGYGGAIPNPGFHPRQWNGGVVYTPLGGTNDASVLAVDSPRVFCAGAENVVATIANYGANQIDSVIVNWEVDGVVQTPLNYIGLVDTLFGANPNTVQLNLGSYTFSAGTSTVKVYTSMPNGVADTTNLNDTVSFVVQTATAPTSIVTSNATLTSMDVTAVGGAGDVDYEYGPIGFAPGTGTPGTSPTSTFTISGLTQGTSYDVYVRSNCGAGDISAYVGPETFNTSFAIPFLQDFENFANGLNSNPYPEGWVSSQPAAAFPVPRWESELGDGTSPGFGTGPIWDHTNYGGPGIFMFMESSGGVQSSVDFVSPPIYVDTALSTVELGYHYFMFGPAIDTLEVIADTNGVETVLATYVGQLQAAQTDPWLFASHFLNGYQGQSVTIKFRAYNQAGFTGGDIAIDDIRLDPVLPLNAGVIEVQSPSGNLCPGAVTPIVGVKNFGSTVLDSVNVVWNVNGMIDSVMFIGPLAPGDTASVTLATLNVNATTIYDIDFYTNRPNNAADQFPADDTLRIQGLRTGLSGTFTLDATIPSSATNIASFAELGQVLNSYGICGPVTINVAAGTYTDILELDNIPGLNAANPLVIDGGDSASVTLFNDLSSDNAVLRFDGVSNVTVKNMTISTSRVGGGNHCVVHFGGDSDNDSLVGVRVLVDPTATFGAYGILASQDPTNTFTAGIHASHIVIMNSSVDGGDNGIRFIGNGGPFPNAPGSGWALGNKVINTTSTRADDIAIYFDDQEGAELIGNNISNMRTTSTFTGYGIQLFDGIDFKISANEINVPYTGIYVTNGNFGKQPTIDSEISNNMVSSGINHGIWTTNSKRVNYWYNSIYCASTDAAFDAALYLDDGFGSIVLDSVDVRNNAIYSVNVPALRVDEPDSVFFKLDNNAYFNASGGDLFNIDGVVYADLAAYQAARPGLNAGSLEGDPQFISSTDLHVVGGFINDAGDNSVPITVDIDGDSRPLTGSTIVDIGADEFDPPLCPPSINLGVANVGLTTADIFWDGVAMDYQYEVVLQGAAQGTGTVTATAVDSVTLTGLTPSTSYSFYTREVCGRGDTSIWIGPFDFNTSNAVPYFEDFETFPAGITGNPFPRGWSSVVSPGTTNPRWESEISTGNNTNSFGTGPLWDNTNFGTVGGLYMYMETSGGSVGDSADLVSPPIFIDVNQNTVTLEYYYFNFGPNIDRMEVLVDSNGVETLLTTIVGAQQAAQTDPWIKGSSTIAGYAGKSITVKFRGFNVNCCSGDIAVDDVRIFEPSAADGGVTDILSPGSGCGLGAADSVTVEISNFGTAAISNFPVVYEFNGAATTETFTGTIASGGVANFTFAATVNLATAGTYTLDAYTNVPADGDLTNDSLLGGVINSIPIVGGFPYSEDFENGNGGWTATGITTFALGTPAGAIINSAANGTQSWATNLTGNYNNGESGWVAGPCFDFSTLVNPVIEMSTWWNSENSWDGAVLQSSIDGGATWQNVGAFGDPDNWYTDNTVNGLANIANPQDGWSGSPGSGGWVTSKATLTGLGGVPGVILRIAFGSDGSVNGFDGFAFDDIVIKESSAYDVALLDIVTPVSGAYLAGTSDSVRVTIANLGSDTATNFTVNYTLNGGALQTELIAQMLPTDTMVYTFMNSSVALPGPGASSTMDVYVDFPLDSTYNNDSIIGYTFDNVIKGYPFTEDFENGYVLGPVNPNGQGNWSGTSTLNPRWEIEDASGANENSTGTGPFYDRTSQGTAGGFYAYLETSGGVLGDQDTLRSPSILIPSTVGSMGMYYSYHMFGVDMGRLDVYMESAGTFTFLDSIVGQQQLAGDSLWTDRAIPLSGAFNGQIVNIVFVGTRGNNFTSDMSIDEVRIDQLIGINKTVTELEGISVSPNPSNGLFNLKIEAAQNENFNVKVLDAQGREVYTANFNVNGKYNDNLDFTSFAKGVYYMQIQTETESKVEKLIIQ